MRGVILSSPISVINHNIIRYAWIINTTKRKCKLESSPNLEVSEYRIQIETCAAPLNHYLALSLSWIFVTFATMPYPWSNLRRANDAVYVNPGGDLIHQLEGTRGGFNLGVFWHLAYVTVRKWNGVVIVNVGCSVMNTMPFSRKRWCLSLQWIMTASVTLSPTLIRIKSHVHVAFWFGLYVAYRSWTLPHAISSSQWPLHNTYIPTTTYTSYRVDKLFTSWGMRRFFGRVWLFLIIFVFGLSIFYVLINICF